MVGDYVARRLARGGAKARPFGGGRADGGSTFGGVEPLIC